MILPFLPKHLPCIKIINEEEWPLGDFKIRVFESIVVQGFYLLKDNRIIRLVVGKEFRGRGIGSALLMDAEKQVKDKFLEVIVEEYNENGLEWLLKKGFLGIGTRNNNYILRKQLW